jgi:hypothetical protein
MQDEFIKLIGTESVLGVSLSLVPELPKQIANLLLSALWSSTPVLMTLARVVTRSPRRPVTLVPALLAVSSWRRDVVEMNANEMFRCHRYCRINLQLYPFFEPGF